MNIRAISSSLQSVQYFFLCFCLCLHFGTLHTILTPASQLQVGCGMGDVTGLIGGIMMEGYAKRSQHANGIHFRLRSRAFIFADDNKRIVFVSLDAALPSYYIKERVVKELQQIYGTTLYTRKNICISCSHTHSAPGGSATSLLYQISGSGFVQEKADAVVRGILASIRQAHDRLQPANIYLSRGDLLDANINRSPSSYYKNLDHTDYPYSEDKEMTLVRFDSQSGNVPLGSINWFPVHGVSMNNTNQLVSGDNKGWASYLFEKEMNDPTFLGNTMKTFVAAFAQSNEGDASPNVNGPFCIDDGLSCQNENSSCHQYSKNCNGRGPGWQKGDRESTRIIATRQYQKAKELFDLAALNPDALLTGPIDYVHMYLDITNQTVDTLSPGIRTRKTCPPAMGFAFGAGTTDGPGISNFLQGDKSSEHHRSIWDLVSTLYKKPTQEQIDCHYPKPILLDCGRQSFPYQWIPFTLELQMLRVGQLVLVSVPGELTTMAGRRLRNTIRKALGEEEIHIVIAGLSNMYSSYVTTPEEYMEQRYEAASTVYGPNTLAAYLKAYTCMAQHWAHGKILPENPAPSVSGQLRLLRSASSDYAPFSFFGKVLKDVDKEKYQVTETVQVSFRGANPRTDFANVSTFLSIQRYQVQGGEGEGEGGGNSWWPVYDDGDICTTFEWQPTWRMIGLSQAVITWHIPENQPEGTYRIAYHGRVRNWQGHIEPILGLSSAFKVVSRS